MHNRQRLISNETAFEPASYVYAPSSKTDNAQEYVGLRRMGFVSSKRADWVGTRAESEIEWFRTEQGDRICNCHIFCVAVVTFPNAYPMLPNSKIMLASSMLFAHNLH